MEDFELPDEECIFSEDFYIEAYRFVEENIELFQKMYDRDIEVGSVTEMDVPQDIQELDSEMPGMVQYRFPAEKDEGYAVPTYTATRVLESDVEDAESFAKTAFEQEKRILEEYEG